jgi:hypothetical protein
MMRNQSRPRPPLDLVCFASRCRSPGKIEAWAPEIVPSIDLIGRLWSVRRSRDDTNARHATSTLPDAAIDPVLMIRMLIVGYVFGSARCGRARTPSGLPGAASVRVSAAPAVPGANRVQRPGANLMAGAWQPQSSAVASL